MVKRYLMVVGVILAVIIALGVWLKPPVEQMRNGLETGIAQYRQAKQKTGGPPPVITHQESRDWLIAVSHIATVDEKTYACVGAFKVTVCNTPDAEDAE